MSAPPELGAATKSWHPSCHVRQAHQSDSTETKLINPMEKDRGYKSLILEAC